jgi:hypothetical protein
MQPFDLQIKDIPVFIAAIPLAPLSCQHGIAPHGQKMTGRRRKTSKGDKHLSPVSEEELHGVDTKSVRMAEMEGVYAKDPGGVEDVKCDEATLTFSPAYFVAAPPTQRFVASPFDVGTLVDVSAYPPGSIVACPVTQKLFTVPMSSPPA